MDYNELTVRELQYLLRKRGLSIGYPLKTDLVGRLNDDKGQIPQLSEEDNLLESPKKKACQCKEKTS